MRRSFYVFTATTNALLQLAAQCLNRLPPFNGSTKLLTRGAAKNGTRALVAETATAWELIRKAYTANLKFIAARAGNIKLLLKLLLHAAGF